MSTAKMVADSTVPSDLPSEERSRRNSSERRRSKTQKKSISKEGSKTVTSEDSDSDLDLSKDLFSIGGYIKDRPEMMEQMFQAVRGPSLRRALPDILLHLPLDDLKQRCLEQLEIMSRKRILRILDGDIPSEISSSGTEDSSGEDIEGDGDGEPNSASSEQDQAEEENIEDAEEACGSEDGSDDEEEFEEGSDEAMEDDAEEQEVVNTAESGDEVEGSAEEDEAVNEVEMVEEEADGESPTSENCEEEAANDSAGSSEAKESPHPSADSLEEKSQRPPTLTKEQMEILELEMRARAIKAMLNKHPKTLIPLLPNDRTNEVQKIGETAKYDMSPDVEGDIRTCKSSKAQKERRLKTKARLYSTGDASVQREGKASKRPKRKSVDSCDSISMSHQSPLCSNEPGDCDEEHDEDSNSSAKPVYSTPEVEPEDGEVASEGEVNDDQENSNDVAFSDKEESEHSVDSSTAA